MTRIVPVIVLVILATSRVASADDSLPGGVTISFDKQYVYNGGTSTTPVQLEPNTDDLRKHFNLAHCQCGKENPLFAESKFEFLLLPSSRSPSLPGSLPIELWVGTDCGTLTSRTSTTRTCKQVNNGNVVQALTTQSGDPHAVIPVYDLMIADIATTQTDCKERNVTGVDRKSTRLNSSHVSISYAV